MMRLNPIPLAILALVAACDESQPLIFDQSEAPAENDAETVTEDENSGSDPDSSAIPPTIDAILIDGTLLVDLPAARDSRGDIARTEARDGGGGFAEEFILNETDDTLTIDNLAFDGLNVYTRGANTTPAYLSDLGTIAVYHADQITPDFLTGAPVDQQDPYIALYDQSTVMVMDEIPADATPEEIAAIQAAARPRTAFTIVRTGAYTGYGFGGFGYERAGDVVIPTTGQATFNGDYAGLRVLSQFPEILVVEGDARIDIDFDDFNEGAGLKGSIFNRQAYLADGTPYPTYTGVARSGIVLGDAGDPGVNVVDTFDDVYASPVYQAVVGENLENDVGAYRGVVQLPEIQFVVRGGDESIKPNGEIGGEVRSRFLNDQGLIVPYDVGSYFGVLAGDLTSPTGGEIVGVIKVEAAEESRFEGVSAQETGGFIASRTQ